MSTKNPAEYAHSLGKRLVTVQGDSPRATAKEVTRQVDAELAMMLNTYTIEETIQIMATLLTTYQLPIIPCRITNFERFLLAPCLTPYLDPDDHIG